ncbi:MAG: hypothetical protein JWN62_2492 [Acidimicrobiales bacterium]|nr:hypothetical protein [Acidimicrobiales bacterium]
MAIMKRTDPERDLSEAILEHDIAKAADPDAGSEIAAPGEELDDDQLPPSG